MKSIGYVYSKPGTVSILGITEREGILILTGTKGRGKNKKNKMEQSIFVF